MTDVKRQPIYIHAASALGPWGDYTALQRKPVHTDPVPLVLKELTRSVVGLALRQASHFVELAVIGAQRRRGDRAGGGKMAAVFGFGDK